MKIPGELLTGNFFCLTFWTILSQSKTKFKIFNKAVQLEIKAL